MAPSGPKEPETKVEMGNPVEVIEKSTGFHVFELHTPKKNLLKYISIPVQSNLSEIVILTPTQP